MTLRHDHTGAAQILSLPHVSEPDENGEVKTTYIPLPLGTKFQIDGKDHRLTGVCAPHEEGAPGCVFVTPWEDSPVGPPVDPDTGLHIQTEYTPEQLGLVWMPA